MRAYINAYNLPKNMHHLSRGNDVNYKLRDTAFNRRLLDYYNVESDAHKNNIISKLDIEYSDYLKDFQRDAINKILQVDSYGLFLSPGCGKTVIVCEALKIFLKTTKAKVCIIAPKTLHKMWHSNLVNTVGVEFSIRERTDYTITNYEHLNKLFDVEEDLTDTIFVYDESGVIIDRKSKRFKYLKKLFRQDNYKKLIFSTGSPYSNKFIDVWSQLNILFPEDFSSYWNFAKLFCDVTIDRYGWHVGEALADSEKLLRYALQDYCTIASLHDLVKLPEQETIVVPIEMNDAQQAIYYDLEERLVHFYSDIESGAVYINNKLDLLTKLKWVGSYAQHLVPNVSTAKFEYLLELMKHVERPCIIFGTLNESLKAINNCVDGVYFASDGESPDRFISGEKDILVTQIKSGRFGFSFNEAKTVIFYDYNFDSTDLWQAKHRTLRLNSTVNVKYYYLIGSKLDRVMCAMNVLKIDSVLEFLKAYKES